MTNQYLKMLEDSLKAKTQILQSLIEMSEQQKDIIACEDVEWDKFDALVEEKAQEVEKLQKLDDGFDAVYQRIREDVISNKEMYKDTIERIQKWISLVTEKSTGLMALEERNRVAVTEAFRKEKQKIRQNRVTTKAATNYYRNMSKVNYIDPQLMDKKK